MQRKPLIIIGAGGLGREVAALVAELNAAEAQWDLLGFLDDDPKSLDGFTAYGPILGGVNDYATLGRPWAVCAIGDGRRRLNVVDRLGAQGVRWARLIHPAAYVAPSAMIDEGSIVARGTSISVDARIGRHVIINLMCMIGHDVQVADYCTISPMACLGGAAVLEEGVFLGMHAVVLPQKRMGPWSCVGAGSAAVTDGDAAKTLIGVPARALPFLREGS